MTLAGSGQLTARNCQVNPDNVGPDLAIGEPVTGFDQNAAAGNPRVELFQFGHLSPEGGIDFT
jgi:hypothetical protein